MNIKFSLFLVIIIAILIPIGAYILISNNTDQLDTTDRQIKNIEITENKKSYLYKISEESISSVEVSGNSKEVVFKKSTNNSWELMIDENTYPVKPERWSGVTILLEGPTVQREIQKKDTLDLEKFGLSPSKYVVKIGLEDNTFINLNFGSLSPDGTYQYVNFNGEDSINTLHKSFGEVFMALLEDPPVPKWVYKFDIKYIVKIGLEDNTFINLNFGSLSPDQTYQYVNFNGEDSINTLHKSFGEVFMALLEDPPVPKWVYKFDVKYIDQVLVYQSGVITNAYGREIFTENPLWEICETEIDPDTQTPVLISEPCEGEEIADSNLVNNLINLIKIPKIITIKEVGLKTAEDFAKYGITKDSTYIALRNNTFTEKGTLLIKPIAISYSDIGENEALAVFQDSEDVLVVDSEWIENINQLIKKK